MKKSRPERSRGAALLARIGETQDEIARKVGVSRVAVSHWLKGATKPSLATRGRILATYPIPITSWDEPNIVIDEPIIVIDHASGRVSGTNVPTSRVTDQMIATFGEVPKRGVFAKAAALDRMAEEMMAKLQSQEGATPLEQAKVMASIASTLSLLAKLTGQYELGSRLLTLPMWKEIEQALERALANHPLAAADVATELRKLDRAA